jgi:GNAT superfamily N-acetyltransferase
MNVTVHTAQHPLQPDLRVIEILHAQMERIETFRSTAEIIASIDNAQKEGSRGVFTVAWEEDQPIGLAFGNIGSGIESGGDYFWLNELYVPTQHRNKGVAQAILDALEDWLRSQSIHYVAGVTGHDNGAALALYQKKGYTITSPAWFDKHLFD